MSIDVGDDVGLEVHPYNDQFLREVEDDDVIMVPAGTWHNVVNTGDSPLKLYELYGPPDHEPGTVHPAHEDAERDPNED